MLSCRVSDVACYCADGGDGDDDDDGLTGDAHSAATLGFSSHVRSAPTNRSAVRGWMNRYVSPQIFQSVRTS